MHLITINPGEEVIDTLTTHLAQHDITNGAIVSIIGAVDTCTISNMPLDDPTQDILTEITHPLELSGTGEIRNGTPHIHCVISGHDNNALAGHLHRATVGIWCVNLYIITIILPGVDETI
jgi:uncharacterized protein